MRTANVIRPLQGLRFRTVRVSYDGSPLVAPGQRGHGRAIAGPGAASHPNDRERDGGGRWPAETMPQSGDLPQGLSTSRDRSRDLVRNNAYAAKAVRRGHAAASTCPVLPATWGFPARLLASTIR
jgi:hypothetical protein